VREHYEFVWQVAYRILGNAEDAADVSQDVFLRLLTRPPGVDAVASPRGYLSWCVAGRASTLRRSAERRRERPSGRCGSAPGRLAALIK
jgi:RNA polymerase sigma-70 factor (ECF subfamily)